MTTDANDDDRLTAELATLAGMTMKEVLEAIDLESMKLLLARVRIGAISAAELATAQAALKRHGIAVTDTDMGKRGELEAALAARRKKRGKILAGDNTPDDHDLEQFGGRLQ